MINKNYLNNNNWYNEKKRNNIFETELFQKKKLSMPIPICECVSVSVCVNDVLLFIVYDGRIQGRRKPRKDEFSQ